MGAAFSCVQLLGGILTQPLQQRNILPNIEGARCPCDTKLPWDAALQSQNWHLPLQVLEDSTAKQLPEVALYHLEVVPGPLNTWSSAGLE